MEQADTRQEPWTPPMRLAFPPQAILCGKSFEREADRIQALQGLASGKQELRSTGGPGLPVSEGEKREAASNGI